jgi:hypothetical protein
MKYKKLVREATKNNLSNATVCRLLKEIICGKIDL